MKLKTNAQVRATLLQEFDAGRRAVARLRRKAKAPAESPFQRGSIIAQLYTMALKGTTISELEKLCADIGANSKVLLRKLHLGYSRGHEWTVERDGDRLTVRPSGTGV